MRQAILAFSIGMLAVAAAPRGPAWAQFALSPRGIIGAMTSPLRGLLGHLHHPHFRGGRRQHDAREGASAPRSDEEANASRHGRPGDGYEALLGYAFWPADYDTDFNRYGFGTIAAAIAGPTGDATVGSGGHARVAANGRDAGALAAAELPRCDVSPNTTSDWLTDRIARTLSPDAVHQGTYDTLRSRLAEGGKIIKERCRAVDAESPTLRLAELEQRLWTIHDAGQLVRPALKAFYDGLSGEQKAKFNAPKPPQPEKKADAATPMGRRYQACAAQSAGATDRMIGEIKRKVRPTHEQQSGLDELQKKSAQMEKLLLASCAQPTPDNPLARLDAANERLVAINFAASNLELALNNFYASLGKRQKESFDSLAR
jgi:hypothetical protein